MASKLFRRVTNLVSVAPLLPYVVALKLVYGLIGLVYHALPLAVAEWLSNAFNTRCAPNKVPCLLTIRMSHYSEKARWAMDLLHAASTAPLVVEGGGDASSGSFSSSNTGNRDNGKKTWSSAVVADTLVYTELSSTPLLHMLYSLYYSCGRSSSMPQMIVPPCLPSRRTGYTQPALAPPLRVIGDSADILRWVSEQLVVLGQPSLYPNDEVAALEKYFGDELGPSVRALVYSIRLPDRSNDGRMRRLFSSNPTYAWETKVQEVAFPFVRHVLALTTRAEDPRTYGKSLETVERIFKEMGERLADGRKFLCDTPSISAADISFAALAYPVLCPPEMAEIASACTPEALGEKSYELVMRMRETKAGQWALNLYRTNRFSIAARTEMELAQHDVAPVVRPRWLERPWSGGIKTQNTTNDKPTGKNKTK